MMNKRDFSEEPILSEKSIYCSKELCRSSGNCLFVGFSFSSFFIVIIPEVRGIFSYTICHNPDDSSCMRASLFRDFISSFELTGLFNDWVKTTETDEFFCRGEFFDTSYFTHKVYGTFFSNTWDRGKDFYFFFKNFLCYFPNSSFYFFFFPLKVKKSFNFQSKELVGEWERASDRGLSEFEDSFYSIYFSSSLMAVGEDFKESLFWSLFNELSRREFKEDGEDFLSENREISLKLREEEGEKSFNFCFSFCDELRDSLHFSDERLYYFPRWSRGDLLYSFAGEEEFRDSFSIFTVRFRWFRMDETEEVMEFGRMNYRDFVTFFFKEGEEIEMIDTCGFHTDKEIFFKRGDRFFKIDKALKVHRERGRGKDGRARRESSGKGIFRNIDTTEIVNHGNTSMDGLEGIALPLNLLAEVSLTSSINQYETGRAEDRLLCESKNSGNMESRPPGLSFIKSFKKFKYHISI